MSPEDALYDAIRRNPNDIAAIAAHTGYKAANIRKVKQHIFFELHYLDRYVAYGIPAQLARFDSDLAIGHAWQRLASGTHGAEDIKLLKHETAEAWYVRRVAPGYDAAHNAAQRRYPAPR